MSAAIRNRIKAHRRVRAGDLVPHEFNFRTHADDQRAALAALYSAVGFARSLLAYALPDGRLKLIDGHLRRDLDPDMEVEVEILDVTEEEARACCCRLTRSPRSPRRSSSCAAGCKSSCRTCPKSCSSRGKPPPEP